MKLHIVSDIHLEFGALEYTPPACDVVICAGDIQPGVDGLIWMAKTYGSSLGVPVIFVAGNHEYWDQTFVGHTETMRAIAKRLGIHFLQNDQVVIDGVRFLGCTLWTDLNLMGNQPLAMVSALSDTKDYRNIDYTASVPLQPFHTLAEHKESLSFLTDALNTPFDGKTVVVTHHSPSELSCISKFRGDPTNYNYASRLDRFVEMMAPELWCHGHVHQNNDYVIGTTRVICNPRGYDDYEPNPEFDPQLVIEV